MGVAECTVRCLRSFCRQLPHRFRYGQEDGSEWVMANGLAQACPASPDLKNIPFEPLRLRSVRASWLVILSLHQPALRMMPHIATSLEEVAGCHHWCGLLGFKLNGSKTSVGQQGPGAGRHITLKFWGESVTLTSRAICQVFGIELGDHERTATRRGGALSVSTSRGLC